MLSILRKIYNSIALLPAGIALFFAMMAIGQLCFPLDKDLIPDFLNGIVVQEKTDLQFIFTFIIGGIFTLTIFSYTMVMNVLNRSINNYSPRLIPLILSERHHQLILGFTSGTIIYSMIMSIALSGKGSNSFPPLGAFVGVLCSIFCVFLFIYFIHSVSQSIHVNYILRKSFDRSCKNLEERKQVELLGKFRETPNQEDWFTFSSDDCGYLQLPQIESLSKLAADHDCDIAITQKPGTFIYKNQTVIKTSKKIKEKDHQFSKQLAVDARVPLELNETEIKHLVEVAIKASSPAINDPGTSLNAIDYITQLLILRHQLKAFEAFSVNEKNFVYVPYLSNERILNVAYEEMWFYMKHDPVLKKALKESLDKLKEHGMQADANLLAS